MAYFFVNTLLIVLIDCFLFFKNSSWSPKNDAYLRLYSNIFLNLSCHIHDHKLTEVRAQSYQADNKHVRVIVSKTILK